MTRVNITAEHAGSLGLLSPKDGKTLLEFQFQPGEQRSLAF